MLCSPLTIFICDMQISLIMCRSTDFRQVYFLILLNKEDMVSIRVWPQHSQSGLIVGQSEQLAIDDNRWPVRANVSQWGYSPNLPSHWLHKPSMQYYSRFRMVSVCWPILVRRSQFDIRLNRRLAALLERIAMVISRTDNCMNYWTPGRWGDISANSPDMRELKAEG